MARWRISPKSLTDAAVAIRRSVVPASDEGADRVSSTLLPVAANAADSRPLVLAADDEPVNLQTIVELLRAEFRLRVASDGVTALELARQSEAPDVILLDIMMPAMNGYEVCRRLKENAATRDIPVDLRDQHP